MVAQPEKEFKVGKLAVRVAEKRIRAATVRSGLSKQVLA
jgi:hypothetical protein